MTWSAPILLVLMVILTGLGCGGADSDPLGNTDLPATGDPVESTSEPGSAVGPTTVPVTRPVFVPEEETDSGGGSQVDSRVDEAADTEPPIPRIAAPEFPIGLDWLNTVHPLSIEALRGKIVMLDFWTYGCINCIHIIPDLERLEEEFADELVVIGVHSAKFDQESGTENIRRVVLRYRSASSGGQ